MITKFFAAAFIMVVKAGKRGFRMKKIICILLAAFMGLMVLSGCQKTPESPIVVGKNAENLIERATADEGSAALPLREQLSAPDMMDVTVEEDHFTILAHAAVRLPETDTIPIITVKAGSFSQELINGLWDLLIGDKNMYKPRTEVDRTKTELEQAILTLQGDMERIEQNEYYEENRALREAELAHLRELYSTAPDTYEPTAVTPEIEQYVDSGNPSRRFMGVDATDNAGTVFRVSNESWYEPLGKGGIQNSKFVYCTPGHNGVVHGKNSTKEVKENDTLDNTAYPGLSMQPKQAAEIVRQFVSALDVPMRVECIALYDNAATEGDAAKDASDWCYLVTCQRMVEQYACAAIFGYSGTPGSDSEFGSAWIYERLVFLVNDSGIVYAEWDSPLEIGDIRVDSCKLLPFAEIQSIFEKMMQVIWQYQSQDYRNLTCNITEARLELMRVLEQGSTENGLLIPVWNFYGTRQRTFTNGETDETIPGVMLSVNAVSGAVIDSAKGY